MALRFIGCLLFLALLGQSIPACAAEASPELEALGEKVFNDVNLSTPPGVACRSCHDPATAFQGNNGSPIAAVARGSSSRRFGVRNVPSIMYALYAPPFHFEKEVDEKGGVRFTPVGGLFWDGRADHLFDQAAGPLLNPVEMNNRSKRDVVYKVSQAAYAADFKKLFGDRFFDDEDAAYPQIAAALAAFESAAQFHPFASKFDDVLRGEAKFTAQEERGFKLFKDPEKGNCAACHVGKEGSKMPEDWLFTDYSFDSFGVPRNMKIPATAYGTYFDFGLCRQPGLKHKLPDGVTLGSLCGAFRVPSLRNVEITGPYMHNGVFENLHDVVAFYATRDTNPEKWYPTSRLDRVEKFNDLPHKFRANINTGEVPYDRKPSEQPRLKDSEIDDIVAFLKTLTDKK